MRLLRWLRRKRSERREMLQRQDDLVGADGPIRTSSQDLLRRTVFAQRIAAILSSLSLDEGRVFAIRGAWGNGKSSLKNLVIEELGHRSDGAEWLEFNPWQWPDADGIARALFEQIADKMGGSYSTGAARRAAKLRKYADILTRTGTPLRKVGADNQAIAGWLGNAAIIALAATLGWTIPAAATIAFVAVALSLAALVVGGILRWLAPDRWAQPLDVVRRDLEASLLNAQRPLAIFVDDIDRLEPDQIRLLIRQVKVNANLPNIVFVLLFQPSIVEAALGPIADGQGREFLEKIVQANFDLPAVPIDRVHRIFTEQLSAMASAHASPENGFEQVRWGNVLIGCMLPYIRNLRDVRRLLSSIAIHMPLHEGNRAFEVNIIDFLALETLRVFEPELHNAIVRHRDLLLQTRRFRDDRQDAVNRDRVTNIANGVAQDRVELAQTVLTELFPPIAWVFNNHYYGREVTEWINQKRVCTTRFFDRYFELQVPEGALSESDFVDFISASHNAVALADIIESFRRHDLAAALAARLDESVSRLPTNNAPILLPAMFELAQSLVATRSADPFNAPWVSAWRSITWYLDAAPPERRSELALAALDETGALSVGAILISLDMDSRGEEGAERKALFDDEGLQKLKSLWIAKIKALAGDPVAMLGHDDLASLLYRWRDFSGSMDEPVEWVANVAVNDQALGALIESFMSVGSTQAWGDRVGRLHETFSRESIEDFFGIDRLSDRLDKLDTSQLKESERHAIEVLHRHLAAWRKNASDPEDP